MNNRVYVDDITVTNKLSEFLLCDTDTAQKVARVLVTGGVDLSEFDEDLFWLNGIYTTEEEAKDEVRCAFMDYVLPGGSHRTPDGLSIETFIDWDLFDDWAFFDVTILGDSDIYVVLNDCVITYAE